MTCKTLCLLNYALMIRHDYDITSSLRRGALHTWSSIHHLLTDEVLTSPEQTATDQMLLFHDPAVFGVPAGLLILAGFGCCCCWLLLVWFVHAVGIKMQSSSLHVLIRLGRSEKKGRYMELSHR
uniref:Uncharacterized protein n=1 Tax=Tanacetum cinerariifolium TaxID=118510 RepID=A0A699Q5B0_TANCI|nr:hypothetical protein [Tanacetum cinerariifolium]